MRWSILIASHAIRQPTLLRLLDQLVEQLVDGVEVVVLWNRGRKPLGDYRRMLVENAAGDYVSFVDDDDRVADDYIATILEAFDTEPDHVGFEVEMVDIAGSVGPVGKKHRAVHSLQYDRWGSGADFFYRDFTPLDPVRRTIALKGHWEGSYAEDHQWAKSLAGKVVTEVFIPRTLYFYDFDQNQSLRRVPDNDPTWTAPVLPDPVRYHPDSEFT